MIAGQDIWDIADQIDKNMQDFNKEVARRLQDELDKFLSDKNLSSNEHQLIANTVMKFFVGSFELNFLSENLDRRYTKEQEVM